MDSLFSSLFTFHYGPIQMLEFPYFSKKVTLIYIPLWSYSNMSCIFSSPFLKRFTFHYGPIQMTHNKLCIRTSPIYIPLWSYSNSNASLLFLRSAAFTFHYGPIQIIVYSKHDSVFTIFTFHYGPIQMQQHT